MWINNLKGYYEDISGDYTKRISNYNALIHVKGEHVHEGKAESFLYTQSTFCPPLYVGDSPGMKNHNYL